MHRKLSKDDIAWYVLRVTYQRELTAKALLDGVSVESFIPVRREKKRSQSGLALGWVEKPLVHNYIFVHDSMSRIYELKTGRLPFLRYVMGAGDDGLLCAQTVPDKQMQDFIRIVESQKYRPVDPKIDLHEGDKVRILTGLFEGVEGVFVRVPDRKGKCVVVRIEGVAAVATPVLKACDVEKVEG